MKLQYRNLWGIIGLAFVTLGIYAVYWIVTTKCELNESGAKIPTAWLLIIPLVQIYFFYKFAEGYCAVMFKDQSQTVAYFLLIMLIFPIGALIMQSKINDKVINGG